MRFGLGCACFTLLLALAAFAPPLDTCAACDGTALVPCELHAKLDREGLGKLSGDLKENRAPSDPSVDLGRSAHSRARERTLGR
jgi:hypothetical protein